MNVTEYRNGKRRWVSAPMARARKIAEQAAEALNHTLDPWEYEERGCEVTICTKCKMPLSIDLDSDDKMFGRPIMEKCKEKDTL